MAAAASIPCSRRKKPPKSRPNRPRAGLTAVKPRVKGARSDADVIAAVRKAIPSHVQVMADANEKCDLHPGAVADVARARSRPAVRRGAAAGARARRLSQAHRSRAQRSRPASICRRARASCLSSRERIASVIQPDLAMVGGLTPVLELSTLAEAFDAIVSPHFLPGLFAHVAAAAPVRPLAGGISAARAAVRRLARHRARRHHDGIVFAGARAGLERALSQRNRLVTARRLQNERPAHPADEDERNRHRHRMGGGRGLESRPCRCRLFRDRRSGRLSHRRNRRRSGRHHLLRQLRLALSRFSASTSCGRNFAAAATDFGSGMRRSRMRARA